MLTTVVDAHCFDASLTVEYFSVMNKPFATTEEKHTLVCKLRAAFAECVLSRIVALLFVDSRVQATDAQQAQLDQFVCFGGDACVAHSAQIAWQINAELRKAASKIPLVMVLDGMMFRLAECARSVAESMAK